MRDSLCKYLKKMKPCKAQYVTFIFLNNNSVSVVDTYSPAASCCNIFPRTNVSNIFTIFNTFTFSGTTKSAYDYVVVIAVMLSDTALIFPDAISILLARGSENIWFC